MKTKEVLFIQGGGENGYHVDKELVLSLKANLGKEYQVEYPEIYPDETSSDFGWTKEIGKIINHINHEFILVGHSFGASMILKYLSENYTDHAVKGIFLLSTPFWSGNEEWQTSLKLQENFADKLPGDVPIFFYHCLDDEEVPFSHFEQYKKRLPRATFREIRSGGHQFNYDMAFIAKDIKTL